MADSEQLSTCAVSTTHDVEAGPDIDSVQQLRHRTGLDISRAADKPVPDHPFFQHFARRRDESRCDYYVLVCWKSGNQTHMIDLPVADPEDEFKVYKDINALHHAQWGPWIRQLVFRNFMKVRRTKIYLGGFLGEHKCERLLVQAEPYDEQMLFDRLEEQFDKWSAKCRTEEEFMSRCPEICEKDPVTNKWEHAYRYCDTTDNLPCPEQVCDELSHRIDNVRGLWFMSSCFQNPILAQQQKSLNLCFETPLIRRYDEIIGRREYDSQPRDLVFYGILLEEYSQKTQTAVVACVIFAITLTVIFVVHARLGDWETAFAAGGVFLAFATIMLFLAQGEQEALKKVQAKGSRDYEASSTNY